MKIIQDGILRDATQQEVALLQIQEKFTVADYAGAIQYHLDTQARSKGYDSIFSAVTYADEPAVPTYQMEGQQFRAWRSRVWKAAQDLQASAQAGQISIPTVSQLIAMLPAPPF